MESRKILQQLSYMETKTEKLQKPNIKVRHKRITALLPNVFLIVDLRSNKAEKVCKMKAMTIIYTILTNK